MILFPDQQRLVAATGHSLRTHGKTVVQAPTGSGKTVLIGYMLDKFAAAGKRVLVLAPRRELVYQIADTCAKFGRNIGVIMAGEERGAGWQDYVATFDTLHARCVQSDKMQLPGADVVIVDEVHMALARTRKELIEAYPDAIHLGFSATPARSDGKGLGRLYNDLVLGPSVAELIKLGRLVPPRYFVGERPNLDGVRVNAGDYVNRELGERVDEPKLVGDIVENWMRHAAGRSTVVFCVNRKHSRHVRDEFERAGVPTAHVDGETPHAERAEIFEKIASGEITVLTNVYVATYGLDIPQLSCAVMARPTKSLVLYIQTIGRVLRTHPGKTDALVLDHSGCVAEHGFIDEPVPWTLMGNARNDREEERKERREPKDIECPECGAIFRATHVCPSCGRELQGGVEAIPYHEADLHEVDRARQRLNRDSSREEKCRFYAELLGYCDEKGKSDGWAAHTYRAKFGVWPNAHKGAAPATPRDEVRGYIKSRQIAYAKSRQGVAP